MDSLNFEHLAERCLMERADQLEMVWSSLSKLNRAEDIVSYMEENFGDHDVHSGFFSKVFKSANGGDFVLKVSIETDDGWVSFAKSAVQKRKSVGNPLFPKIPQRYFRVLPDGRAVAFIEQLKIDDTRSMAAFDAVIENVVLQAPENVMAYDTSKTPFDEAFDEFRHNMQPTFMEEICHVFDISMDHLEDFFRFMLSLFKSGSSYLLDINTQNIGYRANGAPVIYDPISFKRA